jgi:hypothetical protein
MSEMNARDCGKPFIALAAYLPQFHEIEENNLWWGQGFTEWTHLERARPWTRHHQIRRPHASLGQYSLLDPAVMEMQNRMAREHGITGFSVWHYWFGAGRKLLERPLENVLRNKLDFTYCLAWANHSWCNKAKGQLLLKQEYLGLNDYVAFFEDSRRHFETSNYIKIDGKPVFYIYDPAAIPDLALFVDTWRDHAAKAGFPGLHLIGDRLLETHPLAKYFDGVTDGFGFWTTRKKFPVNFFKEKFRTKLGITWSPLFYDYSKMVKDSIPPGASHKYVPTVLAGWDTTPRHGKRGVIFQNFDESAFSRHLDEIEQFVQTRGSSRNIVIIKSWNEWAEGNCLEPDHIHGHRLLERFGEFSRRASRHAA